MLIIGVMTMLVGSLGGVGVAEATPYDCHGQRSGGAVVGTCKGTGEFRIRANCAGQPDRTSPWTKPGNYASISCSVSVGPVKLRGYTFEVRG